jgi:hypothetical protein
LDPAIVGEAARWGSYRRDVHPFRTGPYEQYSRERNFRPEVDRLFRDYFPRRTEVVLRQFRGAGLYPAVDPPEVRLDGGETFLAAPEGRTIYFTTDGTDPRLPGGKVAPSAQQYTRPVNVPRGKTLKVRVFATGTAGGEWSAVVETGEPSS